MEATSPTRVVVFPIVRAAGPHEVVLLSIVETVGQDRLLRHSQSISHVCETYRQPCRMRQAEREILEKQGVTTC